MTKYTLVQDKLYQIFDYYNDKAKECKDFLEWHTLISWYLVESSEFISKSDLSYSDKIKLLKWVNLEITVLYMSFSMQSNKLI